MSNKESLVKLSLNTSALAELNKRQSEINIFEILHLFAKNIYLILCKNLHPKDFTQTQKYYYCSNKFGITAINKQFKSPF